MKTSPIRFKPLFTYLLLIACLACSKDGGDDNPKPIPDQENLEAEFAKVVANAGDFENPENSQEVVEETEGNEIIEGEVWNCKTTTYDALKSGGTGRDGFPLFNPNASVIYPGSLLQGKSLKKATPDVIAVERAGGTVSYNLNNGNLTSSFSVDKVAKSSIQ